MPLPSLSFILGIAVLFYLSTFVIFALLRIVTGVSIQRIGFRGLRRIAYAPRDGVQVYIRGIGVSLHRPSFTQPTWISLNIYEPKVVIDLVALKESQKAAQSTKPVKPAPLRKTPREEQEERVRIFTKLIEWKERIKRLHRQIEWLRQIDVNIVGAAFQLKDIGAFRLERLVLAVDTRSKAIDRGRIFQHGRTENTKQRPAEWRCTLRSLLISPDGKDATEILDYAALSVHGFLVKELDGLRDASIAIKVGRLTVPYDDIENFVDQLKSSQPKQSAQEFQLKSPPVIQQNGNPIDDSDLDPLEEDTAVEVINDGKEFASSTLRGIQEIQLAAGTFTLSKRIKPLRTKDRDVYLNIVMKEFGLDLTRLDPQSPAHRQYFSPKDVSHQALLTAISIAVGVDDGQDHPERMLYIPMLTATVKTTHPYKILQVSANPSSDRNANIVFANLVCTSPSIDLDPKHLPLVLALVNSSRNKKPPKERPFTQGNRRRSVTMNRLLPKAIIKIAVQEPVIRVSLPHKDSEGDYDMIISSVSTMAMDIAAQHNDQIDQHYSLFVDYRHTNHRLYGQSNDGMRHELLFADTVEFKVDINALPETTVIIGGKLNNFSLYLTEPQICEGIRRIIIALKKESQSPKSETQQQPKLSFLRRAPAWLQHVHIEGSDFDLEVSAVAPGVSKYARGVSFHLNSWSVEHKINRDEVYSFTTRRRSSSKPTRRDVSPKPGSSDESRRKSSSPTDGRRLAIHIEGLEGLLIDSIDETTGDPFLALPRFEVAFSTSTDSHGPLLHINSKAEKLYIIYSLYHIACLGNAVLAAKKTFMPPAEDPTQEQSTKPKKGNTLSPSSGAPNGAPDMNRRQSDSEMQEVVAVDFRAGLIQIKATLPADPALMIQIYGVDAGQHRWASPFVRTKLARLYAAAPDMGSVWSRIVSVKGCRFDIRHMNKKVDKQIVRERSFDISAEGIRIGVPHQLVVHAIFDNIINTLKTHEQLHHNFVHGKKEYILEKHPEGPKLVPKINIRTQVLIFELEDSPFEYKLGMIYRVGLIEQRQRLAREDAFRIKVKRMNAKRQDKSDVKRSRSVHHPEREADEKSHTRRSRSEDGRHGRRNAVKKSLRYDTEGRCNLDCASVRSIEQARDALNKFNAQSWRKRIDRSWTKRRHVMKEIRDFFATMDELPEEDDESENIMAMTLRPGLAMLCISDLSFNIDKPSFPLAELPAYMHRVGKGMPMDMQYGLLIPLHVHITMGEARALLRDYPLPLLSIPAIRSGQSPKLPSLSMSTDFVIAEEYRDIESQRHVKVTVMPKEKLGPDDTGEGYSVDVRRTISPVKMYSDIKIDINTSGPTRLTWGTAFQPAIQDMMQVIEGFTKPPMDPSEAVGFWDKIRLSFHSRILVSFKGDGDFHLNLKGSRDPYVVTGDGAGFVMVWRNNVTWKIAQDDDPRKFMTVDSGDYILAIPDYDHFARTILEPDDSPGGDGSTSSDSLKSTAMFKKVVMKLSGNVQWQLGLMYEQAIDGDKRSFDFKNHYDVVLKHPDFAKAPEGQSYDAYRGFRSQHIHMSVAIAAPQSRDWNVQNVKPSDNYNSAHLTPRFFTHFLKWWSLFSGVMSLPVRQGALWGGQEKTSKKFGRHLATIKYNLLLSPVFISHIYKHKDIEDFSTDSVSATGLKMKIDSFMLDLHQRREFFEIPTQNGDSKRTSSMKMYQGQLDFIAADFRAVSASIKGTSMEDVDNAEGGMLSSRQGAADMSRFTITDNDFTWIDMDDFVELDWILPQESDPETKILPLGFTPRFTYFRQTDHGDSISGDETRSSPFGDEATHFCIMTQKNDPRRVQADLIRERLKKLEEQIENNKKATGEQELKIIRETTSEEEVQEKLKTLKNQSETLKNKHSFLHGMLKEVKERLGCEDTHVGGGMDQRPTIDRRESELMDEDMTEGLHSVPTSDESKDFNNRFVVHNAQIKWNNSLRNIILRYIHQVSQRRGFVYYMSRRAVKFILDIVEEKKLKKKSNGDKDNRRASENSPPMSPQPDDEMTIEDRIEQILADGRDFVEADDGEAAKPTSGRAHTDEISDDFLAQNSYHFRLIAPQIQLQSERNPKSVVLIAAKGMHLKLIQIMDKERLMDEISGLVQRRFSAAMDSMQIFVTSTKTFSTDYLHLYSGNRYGAKAGTYWPPWVPMEVMYEFSVNPYGFSRVVQRTSASLKLDKYNNLRLKYNDDVSNSQGNDQGNEGPEHRLNHLTVEFPQFRAICDSSQYFAMYIIIVDLLLYSEPLEKNRAERLEKIMLASDFSDLTGAPELVETLQARIRQLEEIKMHFEIHESLLDRQGWKDRISMDQDLAHCEDELFFMMKAITTSQQRVEDRAYQEGPRGVLHWYITAKELAWHLVRGKEQKFLEFQIRDTSFERTDNSDGSNQNSIEFGRINGYNFLPNAIYRDLIAPYVNEKEGIGEIKDKMLRVQWLMMEAIAGIPVVDYFEVELVPLRVQLERDVAKKLFEYIFPGAGGSAFEGSGFSPFIVKKMLPDGQAASDDSDGSKGPISTAPEPELPSSEDSKPSGGSGTGAGTLEQRLQPTMRISERKPNKKSNVLTDNMPGWSLFQHRNRSQASVNKKLSSNPKRSSANLSVLTRTPSTASSDAPTAASPTSTRKSHELTRKRTKNDDDDLTQMLSRASSYMTLSYFHIHSLILCLSYKGQGKRNIEDVHDLVFRLPSIEYRNKTWSNLDLAMEMKREVIRALVGHAGRIVSNKLRGAPKRVGTRVDGIRESLLLGPSKTNGDKRLAAMPEEVTEEDGERDAKRIREGGHDGHSSEEEGSDDDDESRLGGDDEARRTNGDDGESVRRGEGVHDSGGSMRKKGRRLWKFSSP